MNATLPPREEWDFRTVHRVVFDEACLWEYARESQKIKSAVKKWALSKIAGKTVNEWLCMRLPETERTSLDILRSGADRFGVEFATSLIDHGRFPAPWQTIPMTIDENIRRNGLKPARLETIRTYVELSPKAPAVFRKIVSKKYFAFAIDWDGASVKEILKQFEEWLRAEAKKHPEMSKGTRANSTPFYKLKNLAVLRLSRAGFNYDTADAEIRREVKSQNDLNVLPICSRSKWDEAKKAAEKEIKSVEISILKCPANL